MASSSLILLIYCVLIILASLLGGRLPSLIELTHRRMQILISFVGGLMLGIALFHMLPHALVHSPGPAGVDRVALCVMLGLLVMFFLLRTFHFHHHEPEQLHEPGHDHDCGGHHHSHEHGHAAHHGKLAADMSWIGVFVGLSLHTLMDGLALGASLQIDASHAAGWGLPALGTFLAILLHKPLDALSITALMRGSNWSPRSQLAVNAAFAAMCPLGALLFLAGAKLLIDQQTMLMSGVLAFSAGVFLCISLSDLLPEMEFHSHHRVPLTISLLLGIALAWGIRYLEPADAHAVPPTATTSPVMFSIDPTAPAATISLEYP
ncbi:ZIP family metal transporter [Planctomicrobium sp. SH664]|uniref:ZIP family metal transporter n=1 Tax=Planctomicrobium sp. SH664 TaxID=3448125 RepID=UPI003F5B72F1